MSYNHYKPVDQEMVSKLPIKGELCNYLSVDGKKKNKCGQIYSVDKETYDKIKTLLEGKSGWKLTKGDKVFIIPGYPLTNARVKEYFKKIGVTLTKDIHKATKIAGGSKSDGNIDYGQANPEWLMFEGMSWISNGPIAYANSDFEDFFNDDEELSEFLHEVTERSTVFSNTAPSSMRANINILRSRRHYLTPSLMEMLYVILSKRIPVLDQDTIVLEANSSFKLDNEEAFNNICKMVRSPDKNTRKLGIEMMIHSDYKGKCLTKLRAFAREWNLFRELDKNQTKSAKNFMKDNDMNFLRSAGDIEFYQYVMTPEQRERVTDAEYATCLKEYKEIVMASIEETLAYYDKRCLEVNIHDGQITVNLSENVLSLQELTPAEL